MHPGHCLLITIVIPPARLGKGHLPAPYPLLNPPVFRVFNGTKFQLIKGRYWQADYLEKMKEPPVCEQGVYTLTTG